MSQYYRNLFEKFINREITPSELEQLLQWINENQDFNDVEILEKIWMNLESSEAIDQVKALRIQNKLRARISAAKASQKVVRLRTWWPRVAAGLILAILGALGLMYYQSTPIVVKSDYGEIVELTLPDQSTVRLNANSQISYSRRWNSMSVRTVALDGEAFFEVSKDLKNHKKFVVNTKDLSVEVLGTEFNVDTRAHSTRVYLEAGSVKLNAVHGEDSLMLVPGEEAGFDSKGNLSKLSRDEDLPPINWKEGSIILKDKTLTEILVEYEKVFGEKYIFSNKELLDQSFTVMFPITDKKKALDILKNLTGDPVQIDEK